MIWMAQQSYSEEFFQEIKIVQNIIDRMARNSFMLKGWAVTLVVVSFLVEGQKIHYAIAFLPSLVFWALDAYFLRLESCYKELHKWLIKNRPSNRDKMFDMDARGRFQKDVDGICTIMLTPSLLLFYGTIMVMVLILNVYSTTSA